jgi:hypothetical protein
MCLTSDPRACLVGGPVLISSVGDGVPVWLEPDELVLCGVPRDAL